MACNKVKYGSPEIAKEWAEKYRAQGKKLQVAYYCEEHDCWHLTSKISKYHNIHFANRKPHQDYEDLSPEKKLKLLSEWLNFWIENRIYNELCPPDQKKSLHPFREWRRQRLAYIRRNLANYADSIEADV